MPMELTEKKENKCRTHIVFEVSKYEYVKEEKRSVRPQKDVRAPHKRAISESELKSFYEEVKIVGKKTGKKIGL